MRELLDLLPARARRPLILALILSSIAGSAVAFMDSKVEASEARVLEKVDSMRREDMAVIRAIKEDTDLIKQELIRGR